MVLRTGHGDFLRCPSADPLRTPPHTAAFLGNDKSSWKGPQEPRTGTRFTGTDAEGKSVLERYGVTLAISVHILSAASVHHQQTNYESVTEHQKEA